MRVLLYVYCAAYEGQNAGILVRIGVSDTLNYTPLYSGAYQALRFFVINHEH